MGGLFWAAYCLACRTLSQADTAALFLSRKILLSDFSRVRSSTLVPDIMCGTLMCPPHSIHSHFPGASAACPPMGISKYVLQANDGHFQFVKKSFTIPMPLVHIKAAQWH